MIRTLKFTACAAALLALAACGNNEGGGAPGSQKARTGIWAAGSSTVFPFATRVAETFARNGGGGSAPASNPWAPAAAFRPSVRASALRPRTSPTPRVR